MKARIPLMVFEAEDYRDVEAYKSLMQEGTVINLDCSFPAFCMYKVSIPVEETILHYDTPTMIKIKQDQVNKLMKEIEVLNGTTKADKFN